MVQVMKDFVAERQSRMDSISRDSAIPRTPTITATGPSTYPINALTFETSAFSDPQGNHTFAAMQWRMAEVNPGSRVVSPDEGIVLIRLESSEGTDIREDISRSIVERGFGLIGMNSIDMSLEDIFVHLVTEEKDAS